MNYELGLSQNDEYFAQLDAVCMDPFIGHVFTQVKDYNDILADQYISLEDVTEIVNELNAQWYYLLGEDAVVTGKMKFIDENDVSDTPQPIVNYYENQDVTFRGVCALSKHGSEYEQGQLIVDEDEALYELRIGFIREGIDKSGELLTLTGSARVEEITSLEFNEMISPERARLWLEHFYSDFIDEIDVLMLNPSLEECEMVMRLKDLELTLPDDDMDMAAISKMALTVYVESLFTFDDDMPYAITASGEAWDFTDYGAVETQTIDASSLAKVYKIIWQPGVGDEDNVVRPLLDVAFLGADKDSDPLHMLVPLNIVEDFASLRYDYFYGYPVDDDTSEQ